MRAASTALAVTRALPRIIRWLSTWRRGDFAAWRRLSSEERWIAYIFDFRPGRVEGKRLRLATS